MKKIKRVICNTLIIGYLGVIYFAGVPDTNTFNTRLKKKAMDVAFMVGIWPSWSMFAPNPIKFDSKTYVELTRKDGTKEEHDVEIPLEGVLSTFRMARWMKYSQDNLRNPNQKALLRPAVQHHFHKYNSEANPIVTVEIKRKWLEVPPFNEYQLIPLKADYQRKANSEVLLSENFGN